MRDEKEILDEIKTWGINDKDIRVALLTGSRADPNSNTDLFSDYDIEIVVRNTEKYLVGEKWLSTFGDILVVMHIAEFSLRMVLYKDYLRIDFRIYSETEFKEYFLHPKLQKHWDNAYKILFDKDGLTAKMKKSTFKVFIIEKPDEGKFLSVVKNFWWDTIYVAKSLWRDELFYAKYMLDNIIRFSYLETIIEWHIGLENNWKITTNKHGRFFKRYLDAETWIELEKTFAGSKTEENWKALFTTAKLFGRLAKVIADTLDYSYPGTLDKEMTAYMYKIKDLDK